MRRTGAAVALIAVALSGVGPGASRAAQQAPFRLLPGEFAGVIAAYREVPSRVDRTAFDVAALAERVGSDPRQAYVFVRDEVADEIYPGVLRGPSGTLEARAGNSIDKAILLGRLVSGAITQVRYARCTLPRTEAERLVAALFRPAPAVPSVSTVDPAFTAALSRSGLAPARVAEIAGLRKRTRDGLVTSVAETARADLATVRSALERAGIKAVAADPGSTSVVDDAADHYWLQHRVGDRWEDLDPTIAGGEPGASRCVATETFPTIPDDTYQTVSLKLRNEYVEGGRLRSETVLEEVFRVSDHYGEAIAVVSVGIPAADALTNSQRFVRFVPFMRTHREVRQGAEYVITQSQSAASTTLDAFGGGEDPATLAAQWLDYEIRTGGRRMSGSRALFDLVEPSERAKGVVQNRPDPDVALLGLAQSVVVAVSAGPVHEAAVIERAFRDVMPQQVGPRFDVGDEAPEPSQTPAAEGEEYDHDIPLLAGVALAYAALIEGGLLELDRASPAQVRLTRDQPALTIASLSLRDRGHGRGIISELAIDLRHDRARVLPRSSGDADIAFWTNVLRGLRSGALERHLPAASVRAARVTADGTMRVDTSEMLARAASIGLQVGAHGPGLTPKLRQLLVGYGGARMVPDVTAVTAVVMPAGTIEYGDEPRFAAWMVDMSSGDLMALLDNGLRGQQTVEGKLVRLLRFLENQIRRCVRSGRNIERCRQMFQMWADAANRLRASRGLAGRINVTDGHFVGFVF